MNSPLVLLLLLVAVLCVPLQLIVALLVVLRKNQAVALAVALPFLVLLLGLGLTGFELERLLGDVQQNLEAPDLPDVVLGRRASAWQGGMIGGLGAWGLCVPMVLAAVVASIRENGAKPWVPVIVAFVIASPGPVIALFGGQSVWLMVGLPLLLPGILSLVGRGRVVGVMAGVLGLLGLLVGCWGFASQFFEEEDFRPLLLSRVALYPFLSLSILSVAGGYLLGWLGISWRGPRSGVGAGLVGLAGVGVLVLLTWIGNRQVKLGKIAGMYEATLAQVAMDTQWGRGMPTTEALSGRVLVASVHVPRWLERGVLGVQANKIEGDLIDIGGVIRSGDGLLVPDAMSMEDFYLMLSGTEAGKVGLVGCRPPPEIVDPKVLALLLRDPLMSVGWCGVLPLHLQVGLEREPERELIVLKDLEVDEDGEIRKISDLGFTGAPVLLRAQVDATVKDFRAALWQLVSENIPEAPEDASQLQDWAGKVKGARTVYLGWGVQLDGSDLPVGVE